MSALSALLDLGAREVDAVGSAARGEGAAESSRMFALTAAILTPADGDGRGESKRGCWSRGAHRRA